MGFLVVLAGFLLYRVGTVMKINMGSANIFSASGLSSTLKEDFDSTDSDKDGLTDAEEVFFQTDPFNPDTDGDGFKDGEEIASGCSPVVPRPGDCVGVTSAEPTNLTSMVSNYLAGGLYTGDLKNPGSNPNFDQNIDKIKTQVFLDFEERFADKISILDLKIIDDNSDGSVENYLSGVSAILDKSLLRPPQDQINEIKTALNLYTISPNQNNVIFSDLSSLFTRVTKDLINLNVPSDWKDLHLRLANSTDRFATIYKFISDPVSDPIANVLSVEKFITEFSNAQSIINEYQVRAVNTE